MGSHVSQVSTTVTDEDEGVGAMFAEAEETVVAKVEPKETVARPPSPQIDEEIVSQTMEIMGCSRSDVVRLRQDACVMCSGPTPPRRGGRHCDGSAVVHVHRLE